VESLAELSVAFLATEGPLEGFASYRRLSVLLKQLSTSSPLSAPLYDPQLSLTTQSTGPVSQLELCRSPDSSNAYSESPVPSASAHVLEESPDMRENFQRAR